jgi:hypothetical protein
MEMVAYKCGTSPAIRFRFLLELWLIKPVKRDFLIPQHLKGIEGFSHAKSVANSWNFDL